MVSLSCRISPLTSTVIFLDRSPLATAVVTSALLRTCVVRLPAMEFTLAVRSFQVPATPSLAAHHHGDARELPGHALVEVDHIVEGLRDLAGDAGAVEREASLEIAAADAPQGCQQPFLIEDIGPHWCLRRHYPYLCHRRLPR